jgi:hypothetical protein
MLDLSSTAVRQLTAVCESVYILSPMMQPGEFGNYKDALVGRF